MRHRKTHSWNASPPEQNIDAGGLASRPMATVLDLESSPKLYLEPGQKWLHWEKDELKAGELVPDAPSEARLIQTICMDAFRAFKKEGWKLQLAADECWLSTHTIYDLWHGNSCGSLPVIVRIEERLEKRLWRFDHVKQAKQDR